MFPACADSISEAAERWKRAECFFVSDVAGSAVPNARMMPCFLKSACSIEWRFGGDVKKVFFMFCC